jgi:hypothetical protein
MDGMKLEKVIEEKDLGVIISSNFKVSKLCIKASKKGNQILGLVKKTITCRSKDIVLRLYKSLVKPHCAQAWRLQLVKHRVAAESAEKSHEDDEGVCWENV